MKVITDIYLILMSSNECVKVFSQNITEDFNKRLAETKPVYSADEIERVCYDVANEFRVKWEDANDLGGRTLARTRIRMD